MDREALRKTVVQQLLDFREDSPFIQRTLPVDFDSHLKGPEVSVITGVRRCGKSTFFKQIQMLLPQPNKVYFFDFEDPLLDDFGIQDLQTVYELWLEMDSPRDQDSVFIFYDEIQNVENWERWVRKLAKYKKHKIFVTGSNSQMLSGELATALTGRHRPIHMMPLSFFELCEHSFQLSQLDALSQESTEISVKKNKILESLLRIGGFPRPHLEKNTSLLPLYFNDIITKDIIRRRKIKNSQALVRLGGLLCRENTRLFNRAKTSKILDIKDNSTFSKYCSYFQETFLFYEIRQYSPSLRKQMRSLSKFYCVDPALPRSVAGSSSSGYSSEFENLVFLELKRIFSEIYYWRSQDGREVDFLVKGQKGWRGIQVAYSVSSPETLNREIEALKSLNSEIAVEKNYIVTAAENRTIKTDSVRVEVISLDRLKKTV